MPISSMKGDRFKKMVMKATGTKKYFSADTKRTLNKIGAKKLMNRGTKVSRGQAKKIMRQLKTSGKTKNIASTGNYVDKGYAKEGRRTENLRRQNISDYNRTRQDEAKAAETTKTGGTKAKASASSGGGAPMQNSGPMRQKVAAEMKPGFVGSSYGHTNLKPKNELPKPIEKPKEWQDEEDNIIDMVID